MKRARSRRFDSEEGAELFQSSCYVLPPSIAHEASGAELPHVRIDKRVPCFALLPPRGKENEPEADASIARLSRLSSLSGEPRQGVLRKKTQRTPLERELQRQLAAIRSCHR